MHIVVVIPTYNEAENLPKLVSALFMLPLDLNILIIDDNSPDGTGCLADELSATHSGKLSVMHRTNKQGLSSAYLQAFATLVDSNFDAIAQMDADFSHDPGVLVEMAKCIEDCDVVLGSRYIPGGGTDLQWPLWRKGLSAWANFYARTILQMPFHDVTGGFRMWRRTTLQIMPLERVKASGYVFLIEMLFLAYCLKFKIGETPIYFADRRWGKSKMSFKIQVEAAVHVWQVWWSLRDLRATHKEE